MRDYGLPNLKPACSGSIIGKFINIFRHGIYFTRIVFESSDSGMNHLLVIGARQDRHIYQSITVQMSFIDRNTSCLVNTLKSQRTR